MEIRQIMELENMTLRAYVDAAEKHRRLAMEQDARFREYVEQANKFVKQMNLPDGVQVQRDPVTEDFSIVETPKPAEKPEKKGKK